MRKQDSKKTQRDSAHGALGDDAQTDPLSPVNTLVHPSQDGSPDATKVENVSQRENVQQEDLEENLMRAYGLAQEALYLFQKKFSYSRSSLSIFSSVEMLFQSSFELLFYQAQETLGAFASGQFPTRSMMQGEGEGGDENIKLSIDDILKDRRFKDDAWSNSFIFRSVYEGYAFFAQACSSLVEGASSCLGDHGEQKALVERISFSLAQILSALSPANFAPTNPLVVERMFKTKGMNIIQGMESLHRDIQASHEFFRVHHTDESSFKVGENIAMTPGKVVFQNDLIELIVYRPRTARVFEEPLLIIPPWINKYYILDLEAQRSFVAWCVERGFLTFIISWRNPGASLSHKTFEDYLEEGLYGALQWIQDHSLSGAPKNTGVHVLGYCIGGTFLSVGAMLAHRMKPQLRIKSCTFLATQIDFEKAGDLLLFLSDENMQEIRTLIEKWHGYFPGPLMAHTFNMLRPHDLIWAPLIKKYLLAEPLKAMSVLFWNSDCVNLAGKIHRYYLENFYIKNNLARGHLELFERRVVLEDLTLPSYFLATREDHIAPMVSVYKSLRLLKSSQRRFVVGGSGHVVGIVNHPRDEKYGYWTREDVDIFPESFPTSVGEWLQGAREHKGSWWLDWVAWLKGQATSSQVEAHEAYERAGRTLSDAPGTYVFKKWYEV